MLDVSIIEILFCTRNNMKLSFLLYILLHKVYILAYQLQLNVGIASQLQQTCSYHKCIMMPGGPEIRLLHNPKKEQI